MKKPAKKPVKKVIKNKAMSARLHKRYVAMARKAAATRGRHPLKRTAPVKKRTLSLNGPHVSASTWRNMLSLGRNKNDAAKPRLLLDDYLMPEQLATPSVVDFASEVSNWPMYGNDTIGDCTAACVGHQVQAWTRYTGAEADIPEADIIQLYSAVSGYVPGKPDTDHGATVQDTLAYMRKNGVPVAGHKILAFAQLKDLSQIHDALWMFGSVYLGINFPQSAMVQFDNGLAWTVDKYSPIIGGHAIPLQYAGTGAVPYQVVTWGKLQGMDQAFLDTYVEEAWVVITQDWLDKNGHTPEGLDLQGLGADLAVLTGQPNPFPAPVPVPPAPDPKANVKADLEILAADLDKLARDL